jgi:hypothetical protein
MKYLPIIWHTFENSIPTIFCLEYQMYFIPTYSGRIITSILQIFRGTTPEYPGISVIFQTIFRGIEVGISDFSPSDGQSLAGHFP